MEASFYFPSLLRRELGFWPLPSVCRLWSVWAVFFRFFPLVLVWKEHFVRQQLRRNAHAAGSGRGGGINARFWLTVGSERLDKDMTVTGPPNPPPYPPRVALQAVPRPQYWLLLGVRGCVFWSHRGKGQHYKSRFN